MNQTTYVRKMLALDSSGSKSWLTRSKSTRITLSYCRFVQLIIFMFPVNLVVTYMLQVSMTVQKEFHCEHRNHFWYLHHVFAKLVILKVHVLGYSHPDFKLLTKLKVQNDRLKPALNLITAYNWFWRHQKRPSRVQLRYKLCIGITRFEIALE